MTSGHVESVPKSSSQPSATSLKEPGDDRQLWERFVKDGDQGAFAALLERFGPMVLAVCRRVLADEHDAEDAFQATFVVFLRKASAIRKPELLGNWLYGVAYRIALKARANAAKRAAHERQAACMPTAEPQGVDNWAELRAVLDEELNRLPEKYRAPLVLCYLQGKTNAEAARCLGWPAGSMSWRLHQGREKLRQRIQRRARAFLSIQFSSLLNKCLAPAPVPEALRQSTANVITTLADPATATGGAVSASVAELAADAQRLLVRAARRRLTALVALLLLLLVSLGAFTFHALAGGLPAHFNKNLLFGDPDGCGPDGKPKK